MKHRILQSLAEDSYWKGCSDIEHIPPFAVKVEQTEIDKIRGILLTVEGEKFKDQKFVSFELPPDWPHDSYSQYNRQDTLSSRCRGAINQLMQNYNDFLSVKRQFEIDTRNGLDRATEKAVKNEVTRSSD